MTKHIHLSLVILIGFFCSQAHAQKIINLSPNETRLLTNNALWRINATCTIQSNKPVHGTIRINVLKNKGVINGKSLSTGHATTVAVKNNSSISVSAEAGTQINLINLSNEGLKAVCNT